jgi:hypothetical protein
MLVGSPAGWVRIVGASGKLSREIGLTSLIKGPLAADAGLSWGENRKTVDCRFGFLENAAAENRQVL